MRATPSTSISTCACWDTPAALSILTALLFGLAPAVRAARADLGDTLKAQTRSVMGGRLRLPRLLVSIQIALCLAALVAAGLLGRSLENLKWMDVGFDRDNLAYASVSPSRAGYSAERVGPYVDRVREELARLPGVVRVSPVSDPVAVGRREQRPRESSWTPVGRRRVERT